MKEPLVHLLPPCDEYFIAYKDRSALSAEVERSARFLGLPLRSMLSF
ncbi:MAG: hypothetical protein WEB06_09215 [Actinomycetota bacterium]